MYKNIQYGGTMKNYIQKISAGGNLTFQEAENAITDIFTDATDAQIAGLLMALKMKGETVNEIAGFASGMQKVANTISPNVKDILVDIVGTGGDKHNTINVSTAAAIIASAAGINIAKHGNRAITSLCGSADVLEELGIPIGQSPQSVQTSIENIGIGFMLAPVFHPAMKRVTNIRKEMNIRTIFNILGPLTNPAHADAHVIGVYDPDLCEIFAHVLKKMGSKRALIVHGDGMDEISNISETKIAELKDGKIKVYTITPEDFGIRRAKATEIVGGTPKENAHDIIYIFKGEKGPKRDIIVLNAAATLYIANKSPSIKAAIPIVEEILDSGKAMNKLKQFSNRIFEVPLYEKSYKSQNLRHAIC